MDGRRIALIKVNRRDALKNSMCCISTGELKFDKMVHLCRVASALLLEQLCQTNLNILLHARSHSEGAAVVDRRFHARKNRTTSNIVLQAEDFDVFVC